MGPPSEQSAAIAFDHILQALRHHADNLLARFWAHWAPDLANYSLEANEGCDLAVLQLPLEHCPRPFRWPDVVHFIRKFV